MVQSSKRRVHDMNLCKFSDPSTISQQKTIQWNWTAKDRNISPSQRISFVRRYLKLNWNPRDSESFPQKTGISFYPIQFREASLYKKIRITERGESRKSKNILTCLMFNDAVSTAQDL
jgi:hypothetical protein